MADEQRINGNVYGHSSIILKLDNERFYGFKSISYGDSRERGKIYGAARHAGPRGRTAGKYTTEPVAVSMEKESAKTLRDALAARSTSGTSFGNVEFQIVVQYEEGAKVVTDTIERCTWTKVAAKSEEGADGVYEEIEFDCMFILWNGKALFDDSQGNP